MQASNGELVPGGLAMVYGLVNDTIDNGKVVSLIRLAQSDEVADDMWEPGDWLCYIDGEEEAVFAKKI